MEAVDRPKVGVGVLVFKNGKVLLGKRKKLLGNGEFGGTGGHLEHLESIEACAKRETLEEAGIEITNVKFLCVSNVTDYAPNHYLDIGVTADWVAGEPTVMEPEKLESWAWYNLDNLPEPQLVFIKHYFMALKTGQNYWDSV